MRKNHLISKFLNSQLIFRKTKLLFSIIWIKDKYSQLKDNMIEIKYKDSARLIQQTKRLMTLQSNKKIKSFLQWRKTFINILKLQKEQHQMNIKISETNHQKFKKLFMIKPEISLNKIRIRNRMKLISKRGLIS